MEIMSQYSYAIETKTIDKFFWIIVVKKYSNKGVFYPLKNVSAINLHYSLKIQSNLKKKCLEMQMLNACKR